jgi:ABC-2 type transport system permease protein
VIIFPQPLSWTLLLAIPAFLILILNGAWIAVLSGIVATRFRDIPPIIASATQLLFFMTPIVWSYERFRSHPLATYIEINPVLHYVEMIRQPMLGLPIQWHHWYVVGAITVVGCVAALVALRNYRSRVAYWV